MRDTIEESSEEDLPKQSQDTLSLQKLVERFSSNRKNSVEYLARIVVQVMIGNNVYLAHNDISESEVICNNIRLLFANQEIPLHAIRPGENEKITGLYPVVFDLEAGKFLTDGISAETKHFQLLIKNMLDEEDGHFRLKSELSKILFSYGILRTKLLETRTKYLDTQLAKEASIDVVLIPVLLKMAEMERIDIRDRVTFDGLGRALRSF